MSAVTVVDATFELLDEAPARGALPCVQSTDGARPFQGPVRARPRVGATAIEQLAPSDGGPALFWTAGLGGPVVAATLLGADRLTPIPLFTRLLSDEMIEPLLRECGGTWERARHDRVSRRRAVASIWRGEDGSVFLPFDPNEVVESFWTERYLCTHVADSARSVFGAA